MSSPFGNLSCPFLGGGATDNRFHCRFAFYDGLLRGNAASVTEKSFHVFYKDVHHPLQALIFPENESFMLIMHNLLGHAFVSLNMTIQ